MAIKKFDVVAVTGKYVDRQGNEKSRYLNVGAVFENDRGNLSLKLEALPVGNPEWTGWLQLFEPRDDQQQGRQQGQRQQPQPQPSQRSAPAPTAAEEFEDDIPFQQRHWLEG
jgi:hypothetical protein